MVRRAFFAFGGRLPAGVRSVESPALQPGFFVAGGARLRLRFFERGRSLTLTVLREGALAYAHGSSRGDARLRLRFFERSRVRFFHSSLRSGFGAGLRSASDATLQADRVAARICRVAIASTLLSSVMVGRRVQLNALLVGVQCCPSSALGSVSYLCLQFCVGAMNFVSRIFHMLWRCESRSL